MKIGFDAKRLFQNTTGLGNYSRTLVDNLHTYHPEHEIYLYAPRLRNTQRTAKFLSGDYHLRTPKGIARLGWRSMGVVKEMKRNKVDLYHGLSHELPLGIKNSKISSVVTIHDLLYKYFPEDFPWVDRIIYDNKFRFACEHSSRIIAISEATRNDIIKHYKVDPDKIEVIYQTVSTEFSRNITDQEALTVTDKYKLPAEYILNVGSVIKRKNLEILIRALALIPDAKRIPLVIVGTGSNYKEFITGLIISLNLDKWIIWISGPSLAELNILYRKSLFSVYPSLMEGFGLPVLESIMAGTPVITTNRSSLTEAGGKIAHYISGDNAEELCEKMMQLSSGSSDMNTQDVHDHLNKFDAKKLTEQLNGVYKTLDG